MQKGNSLPHEKAQKIRKIKGELYVAVVAFH
jgi:hypothetical protein